MPAKKASPLAKLLVVLLTPAIIFVAIQLFPDAARVLWLTVGPIGQVILVVFVPIGCYVALDRLINGKKRR